MGRQPLSENFPAPHMPDNLGRFVHNDRISIIVWCFGLC
jgi:hypothetical protein